MRPRGRTSWTPTPSAALDKLKAAGFLAPADADALIASAGLQHALTQVLRIALDETPGDRGGDAGAEGAADAGGGMERVSRQVEARLADDAGTQTRDDFQPVDDGSADKTFRREGQMHRAAAAARCR